MEHATFLREVRILDDVFCIWQNGRFVANFDTVSLVTSSATMPRRFDASRPRLTVCFLVSGASVSTTAPHSSPAPQQREEVLDSSEIKGALKVVRAWHAGDYVTFFRAFRQQGVMHRCLMSQYVKPMRDTAIKVRPSLVLLCCAYACGGRAEWGAQMGKSRKGISFAALLATSMLCMCA